MCCKKGVYKDEFDSNRVETIDGSAVEGEDYEPIDEILTFEPNEREKEVIKFKVSLLVKDLTFIWYLDRSENCG